MRALVLAIACLTGCLDDVGSLELRALADADAHVEGASNDTVLPPETLDDLCELLPPDGPCSLACTPGALGDTLPPDTCAALRCPLTDGRTVTIHACNIDDDD